ncbi:MAG: gliding motility-associated ABC transporter permease subunit GldF [Bacteroidota bacterium]|nr:gliding motility-associated ABC transporter permease subunit GldF [Bacteroidota bacterium]
MFALFKKEITLFFSSLIGYIAIGVFLIACGLFIWVLPDFNVLNYGYATLEQLFSLAPFVFLFLIPAITMRSFAEERKSGTIEILSTKPVTDMEIVGGKYFAGLVLVLFSLLPTLFYYYTIQQLAVPGSSIDAGATWGSYIGLLFLAGAYLAIGLFASALTDNQIVAFIAGMFLCFFFFQLLDFLRGLSGLQPIDSLLEAVSIQSHYHSISRGVVDSRDIVYFITFILAFLFGTKTLIQSRKW